MIICQQVFIFFSVFFSPVFFIKMGFNCNEVLLFKKIIFFQDELDNLTWVQLSVARQRLGPSDFLASQNPLQSGVGEGFVKHPVSQSPVRIFFENSNSALIGRPCPTCKNGHPCFSYN